MAKLPSPFASSRISSPYGRNHDRFHTGTDWAVSIGTPIYASGPGVVVFSGWNGDRSGWVKTVRYDAVPNAQRPMYCHLNGLGGPGLGGRVNTGDLLAYSGNSGNSTGPHLHVELVSGGDPMKLVFDPNRHVGGGSPAGREEPEGPPLTLKGDKMIRIQSPGRGLALIGPGYYRHLANSEEVQQSEPIITKHLNGNDRQFDLWVSMASTGVAPSSLSPAQIKAIADATAKQIDVGDVAIDYDRIADAVREKFSSNPLK